MLRLAGGVRRWKPQKIAALALSIVAVLANVSSILAIAKVKGRMTPSLK